MQLWLWQGESAINPVLIQSLAMSGALSRTGMSRPFDQKRDGFIIGEGGGALILETEEHALKTWCNHLC